MFGFDHYFFFFFTFDCFVVAREGFAGQHARRVAVIPVLRIRREGLVMFWVGREYMPVYPVCCSGGS